MYQPRAYRYWIKDGDLVSFTVAVKQTDLYIRAHHNLRGKAITSVLKYRASLEKYISRHPLFLTTLGPYEAEARAPLIIREMAKASAMAEVGPMAAVAGAIAEAVGKDLLRLSPEVIVENGGDVFLKTSKKRLLGIHAGQSPFTAKIGLEIKPDETPLGICTSSATVGHSLSLGSADAVIVLSSSTSLADAAATAIGNVVRDACDIPEAIGKAQSIEGLQGTIIIKDDKIALWGKVKIVALS